MSLFGGEPVHVDHVHINIFELLFFNLRFGLSPDKRIIKMKEKHLSIIEALHLIAVLARHDLTLRVIMMIIMNKTISDGGITVDFWIFKVHTSN